MVGPGCAWTVGGSQYSASVISEIANDEIGNSQPCLLLRNGGIILERLKNLDRFQKIILVLAAALVLLFSVLYPVTIARKGFSYRGAILVPKQSGGDTVYSGSIWGEHASFTVYADKTVEFRYQGKLYGPYTVREDSTAVPHNSALGAAQDGIELREGETTLFRGVVRREDQFITLYHEDGSVESELAVGKISVYVENGGWGADYGVPIGGLMMEQYIKGKLSPASEALAAQMQARRIAYGSSSR